MIQFELINEQNLTAPDADQFKVWLHQVAENLEVNGEICIKLVDASESQLLNKTYRDKDKATNVLSFPADIPEFVESNHLGDLAICAEVVIQEAKAQSKTVNDHWAHMTIHGVLHLLGYDHIDDKDAEVMESLEVKLLDQLKINDPYH